MTKYTLSKLFIFLVFMASALSAKSIVREIKISRCPQPIAASISKQLKGLNYSDTAIINFDKAGTFYIDRTVETRCNTIIKGISTKKTIIIVTHGIGANGLPLFLDDCFFSAKGTENNKISVAVHDLTIKIEKHKGIYWTDAEKYLFKFYHASKVDFINVASYLNNAVITNLDMRTCSNITVRNCVFENNNNCRAGGCLWIRGATSNIAITNNIFRKYGNDEVIAIWGADGAKGTINKDNIVIADNKFSYGYSGKDKRDIPCDIYLNFYEGDASTSRTVINGITLERNAFQLDAPVRRLIAFNYSNATSHKNISANDNTIQSSIKASGDSCYMADFDIKDTSNSSEPITIENNIINGNCKIIDFYGTIGHSCVSISGGNVLFKRNTVSDAYGTALVSGNPPSGSIQLINNNCSGLYMLSKITAPSIQDFSIMASNNIFQGDTRIYSHNLKYANFKFNNNTFYPTDFHFFLQEFADSGDVIFENNIVFANPKCGGAFYANYSKISPKLMNVYIRGNTFYNLKINDIATQLDRIKHKTIISNKFVDKK